MPRMAGLINAFVVPLLFELKALVQLSIRPILMMEYICFNVCGIMITSILHWCSRLLRQINHWAHLCLRFRV